MTLLKVPVLISLISLRILLLLFNSVQMSSKGLNHSPVAPIPHIIPIGDDKAECQVFYKLSVPN